MTAPDADPPVLLAALQAAWPHITGDHHDGWVRICADATDTTALIVLDLLAKRPTPDTQPTLAEARDTLRRAHRISQIRTARADLEAANKIRRQKAPRANTQ